MNKQCGLNLISAQVDPAEHKSSSNITRKHSGWILETHDHTDTYAIHPHLKTY